MPKDRKPQGSGWPPSRAIILAALIVVLTVLQTAKMRGWFERSVPNSHSKKPAAAGSGAGFSS